MGEIAYFGNSRVSLGGRVRDSFKSTQRWGDGSAIKTCAALAEDLGYLLVLTMLGGSQQYVIAGKGESNASSFC